MKYAIITGASKGLGESVAKKMIEEGIAVISVARSESIVLRGLAEEKNLPYQHYSCNLADESEVISIFNEVNRTVFEKKPELVYVVNNAGVIEPIDTVGNLETEAVKRNVQVNLTAPILISNLFLKKTQNVVIVNVTSGAAERPIHGWSVYCTTKAGLNMFTKNVALELDYEESSSKMIAFSPGVMDTDMQTTIRSSSEEAFADLEKFKKYKESGMLRSADSVGNALVDLLLYREIENGKIYNVNELL